MLRGSYATLAWASWLGGGWQATWLSRTGVGSEAGKKYSLCSLEYFGVVGASTDVWRRHNSGSHDQSNTQSGASPGSPSCPGEEPRAPPTTTPQHQCCTNNLRRLLSWQHRRRQQQEVSASTTITQITKENAEDGGAGIRGAA